jgi:hypothetical protein
MTFVERLRGKAEMHLKRTALNVRQPSSSHCGFALMGVPACQQEINDSQHHHHESIDKEPAIPQHENVTENYGAHPRTRSGVTLKVILAQ